MEVRILLGPPSSQSPEAVNDPQLLRSQRGKLTAQEEDARFMRGALDEACRAAARGEVPVGALAVVNGTIIARAHNLREVSGDPTSHAELIVIRKAAARLQSWRLDAVTIYVTLEPCAMCAGALVNSRVRRVVWGCDDPKAGAVRTLFNIGNDSRLNHRFECTSGVLADESAALLRAFFKRLR